MNSRGADDGAVSMLRLHSGTVGNATNDRLSETTRNMKTSAVGSRAKDLKCSIHFGLTIAQARASGELSDCLLRPSRAGG
jgi:hypothetical protein